MSDTKNEFRVMTSGAFTAAYLELIPQLERLTKCRFVTVTTSIGTGETSLPNRLKRGEIADIVIVAEPAYRQFVADGLVLSEGHAILARSVIAMAVRAGAPKPDISSADALKKTLLQARSIGYSASESGKYFTTQLVQRLGIADQVLGKSRLVGGGERVGAVVARGELEIGFQQLSELLPVQGIAHITPLPPELQKVTSVVASVSASSPDRTRARSVISFLASPEAAQAITSSGLEPMVGR
ncbi:MAG TPA: substrate-binding domain-containing protein [Burkholderiales bacterium]|nr:substrate-binding domain-containing protein [Burkholderiales bacterium]